MTGEIIKPKCWNMECDLVKFVDKIDKRRKTNDFEIQIDVKWKDWNDEKIECWILNNGLTAVYREIKLHYKVHVLQDKYVPIKANYERVLKFSVLVVNK